MSSSLISVTRGLTGNRDVGSIADGMAPSTPTAALRLCLQQRGLRPACLIDLHDFRPR